MASVFDLFRPQRSQRNLRGRTAWHNVVLQMLFTLSVVICFSSRAAADSQVVWQIGKFDQSSSEFKQGEVQPPVVAEGHARSDVLYIVGKSNPATGWPAFQPGSSNGSAGFRPHPYTIQFDLPEAPQGLYAESSVAG